MIEVSVRPYINAFQATDLKNWQISAIGETKEEAVKRLGVILLGEVLFNYSETIVPDIWQIEKVEPVSIGGNVDVYAVKGDPVAKRETNRVNKARSRANKVQLSIDLSLEANAVLEALAKEFGGKKAAIEALLKEREQRSFGF